MDGDRLAGTLRSVRIRRGWTQDDVAAKARVHRSTISRMERGYLSTLTFDVVERVCAALEIRLRLVALWRGGDLDRLLNAGHSALHEEVARFLQSVGGWITVPELTYSIAGERGAIDLFCWHAATRSLLIIELKTELVDVNDLLSSMDRRLRLALRLARDRGWEPRTVSGWIIVAAGTTNRRRLAAHVTTIRNGFPTSGLTMRSWCRQPTSAVRGLSLWSTAHPGHVRRSRSTPKRVRHPRTATSERGIQRTSPPETRSWPEAAPNVLATRD